MKTVYLSVRLKNYENALALVGAPLAETPENADVLLLPGGGDITRAFTVKRWTARKISTKHATRVSSR